MDNNNFKILTIDDKHENHEIFKVQINELFPDALIFTALDGKSGLELACTKKTDVILLDIFIEIEGGFEFLKKLKQDNDIADIPVILLVSDTVDVEHRKKALELGADG